MASLYELKEQFLALFEAATSSAETEGEIGEHWVTLLESIEGDIESKLEGCVRVYQSLNAHTDGIKREAARLAERARLANERAENLKTYMKEMLEEMGVEKQQAGPFVLTIRKNSQPSVMIVDINLVPDCYDKEPERQIDKKLVADSFAINVPVPGCVVERGTHLRIQ